MTIVAIDNTEYRIQLTFVYWYIFRNCEKGHTLNLTWKLKILSNFLISLILNKKLVIKLMVIVSLIISDYPHGLSA